MAFKLVTVHDFHDRHSKKAFKRGDVVTNQEDVARLMVDRHKHFVRVSMSAEELAEATRSIPVVVPKSPEMPMPSPVEK